MLFRSIRALGALLLIVLGSGCCHDNWCCHRPLCAPRCQPVCCPESGCCNVSGYLPPQTVAPPVLR